MVEARRFARTAARGAVISALVGGILTLVSNAPATADTPAAVDMLSIVSGAGLAPPIAGAACRAADGSTVTTAPNLCGPSGVATDTSGNVYVVDSGHDEVVKFGPTGAKLATYGSRDTAYSSGTAGHPFNEPTGVAVSASGNVFIANTDDNTVYEIPAGSNTPVVIAGISHINGAVNFNVEPKSSPIPDPLAVAVDPAGNLYVSFGAQIIKITNPGQANAQLSNVISTQIHKVTGIAWDPIDNSLILADWDNSVSYVEKLSSPSSNPTLSIVAGTGAAGAPTPGRAASSALNRPSGVSVDAYGNIFVAEYRDENGGGGRVDKIDTSGVLTVLAGNATDQFPTPGPAAGQPLGHLYGITIDVGSVQAQRGPSVYVTNSSKSGQLIKISLVANPGAPANLVATPGNGIIGLSFSIPADSGYSPVLGYQISVNGGAWTSLATSGAGGLQTAALSAANGTTYSIAVRAFNAQGLGPASNVVSATPQAPAAISAPGGAALVGPAVTPVWFKDPLSAAQRRTEIAVPRSPASYVGKIQWTIATYKSRNGTVAIGVSSIRGRHLSARQAATFSGDNLFRVNTATLTGAGKVQLRSLVASLQGDKTISCEGYTDYAGNGKQLQTLSAQRAAAVCAALRAGGAQVRFTSVGYGMYRPVIVGGTVANRVANRRVVILVTG